MPKEKKISEYNTYMWVRRERERERERECVCVCVCVCVRERERERERQTERDKLLPCIGTADTVASSANTNTAFMIWKEVGEDV